METPTEFMNQVDRDIECLDNAYKLNSCEKLKLHRRIDARYQACIENWYTGLWGASPDGKNFYYSSIEGDGDGGESLIENLQMMKGKLESFRYGVNAVKHSNAPTTNVNVTANINLNLTFEQARTKVEDMTSLTDTQTQEILARIDEIEQTIKGSGSKKSKWEKIKPVLGWLANKSFDVGMTLLPLLLKINEQP